MAQFLDFQRSRSGIATLFIALTGDSAKTAIASAKMTSPENSVKKVFTRLESMIDETTNETHSIERNKNAVSGVTTIIRKGV